MNIPARLWRLRFVDEAQLASTLVDSSFQAPCFIVEVLCLDDRKYFNVRIAWAMFTVFQEDTYEPNLLAANAISGRDFVAIYSGLPTMLR